MLVRVPWSESFAASVGNALGSDLFYIRRQVALKICDCWQFQIDGKNVASVITRMETDTMVIVAYEGRNVKEFGDYMMQLCVAKQIPYVRFHTQRPGLITILKGLNPEPLEYVTRIKCYGRSQ